MAIEKRTMKELLKDLEILYMQEWKLENTLNQVRNDINQIKLELLTNLNLNK